LQAHLIFCRPIAEWREFLRIRRQAFGPNVALRAGADVPDHLDLRISVNPDHVSLEFASKE
jgi:hypothetical protein